jgi:Cysteine rich repeat
MLLWPGIGGKQMLKILSICATVSFLFVSSAMAQSGVGACRADIKKVCGDIKPGGSRIATCLKERVADLSDVCKARLAGVAAARKTCNGEVEKQCGAKGRIQKLTCIKSALTNLGDDCKAEVVAIVTRKK